LNDTNTERSAANLRQTKVVRRAYRGGIVRNTKDMRDYTVLGGYQKTISLPSQVRPLRSIIDRSQHKLRNCRMWYGKNVWCGRMAAPKINSLLPDFE